MDGVEEISKIKERLLRSVEVDNIGEAANEDEMVCPECGTELIPAEGCAFCPSCGWSPCK